MTGKLTLDFQNTMLALCFKDQEYASLLLHQLGREEVFDKAQQLFWNYCFDYYKFYKLFPSLDDMRQIASKIPNASKKQFLVSVIGRVEELEIHNPKFIKDETTNFVKKQYLTEALEKSIHQLNNDCLDEVEKTIRDAAIKASFDISLGHNYFEDAEKRLNADTQIRKNIIPTGYRIDEYLSGYLDREKVKAGGIGAGEVGVVLGAYAVGKTTCLTNLACNAMTRGRNVLYISFEIPEDVIARKIDMKLFRGVSHNNTRNLRAFIPDEFKHQLEELRKMVTTNLIIKDFPAKKVSTIELEAYLDNLKMRENFSPDVVFVDYLGLMKSERNLHNKYDELNESVEYLKGVAKARNIAIWTAHQTRRGAKYKEVLEASDVADAYSIFFASDIVLGLSASEENRASDICHINILKNRFGQENIVFPMLSDLKNSTFLDHDTLLPRVHVESTNQKG